MNDHPHAHLDAAREAAVRGDLRTWVVEFLRSPGSDNAALADLLDDPPREWLGPLEIPMDRLHRLAGPEDQPTLDRFDEDDLETVEGMQDSIEDGWQPPPAIVSFRDGQLVVEDGNHRIEGLRQAGADRAWAIVCFDDVDEMERFVADLEEVASSGTD